MKTVKKILKVLLFIVLLLVAIVVVWWFLPARTPHIKSKSHQTIASLEYLKIGGIEQCVLIRSENSSNPIILFLHGGPGMPMMYLAHEFQKPLEKHFTVVQWDRRGAGKSYTRNIPPIESINTRQVVNDAYDLIDTLRHRYGKNRIILVGHSYGTYLGSIMVNEHPELFSCYVSIGQVVDDGKAAVIQERFIREQAIEHNRRDIIDALNNPRKPSFENWLFEFGGELKHHKSFMPLIWSGLFAPEYTLKDAMNVAKGSGFNLKYMKENVLDSSIYFKIRNYKVPVYFFVGTNDYTTPAELITEYYHIIQAPEKGIIRFENSAHFPFYEEPEKFCNELIKTVRPEIRE
ncbi:MAG TPA: alpha/beta hydrolase [Bacteroidales bacterium]